MVILRLLQFQDWLCLFYCNHTIGNLQLCSLYIYFYNLVKWNSWSLRPNPVHYHTDILISAGDFYLTYHSFRLRMLGTRKAVQRNVASVCCATFLK